MKTRPTAREELHAATWRLLNADADTPPEVRAVLVRGVATAAQRVADEIGPAPAP